MKQDSSTISWNNMSEEWCKLVENPNPNDPGYFIMPYTLERLGDVSGMKILDLGCGEGRYSRELAHRGAEVTAVDCAEFSIKCAKEKTQEKGLDILYLIRNSNDLYGIENDYFDLVLCSMMLMDCEDLDGTVKEAVRVLKPSGTLFASVLHPCFTGGSIWREGEGLDRRVVVGDYFNTAVYEEPLHRGNMPVIWRHRTLEEYVKTFVKNGLTIVDLNEPRPTDEQAKISVGIAWLQKIPLFLFWELKK